MSSLLLRCTQVLSSLPKTGWSAAILLSLLALAIGIIKYGISLYSGWGNLFHVTLNPQQPSLDPSQDFVLPNAIFAAFLGLLGVETAPTWISIHLILALGALALPFFLTSVRSDSGRLRVLFILLVGGPIVPQMLQWVGSYDAFAVIGLTVVALTRAIPLAIIGWLMVGLAHAELGLAAAFMFIAYRAINEPVTQRVRRAFVDFLTAAPPLIVMLVITQAVVNGWGGSTSRIDLILANPFDNVYKFALVMPAMLFSVLGILWVILLRKSEIVKRRSWSLVAIVLLTSFTLPFALHDHTRVLGILMYPLVLTWLLSLNFRQRQRLWSRFAIAASIIPIPLFAIGTVAFGGIINLLTWRAITG
jgi:hypothetical protein